jgi:hypothetical protein
MEDGMQRKSITWTFMMATFASLAALQSAGVAAKPPSNVPGAEAYQTVVSVNVGNGSNGSDGYSSDPVPADRRLVVEFVSVWMLVPPNQKPMLSLIGTVNGAGMPYVLPLTLVGKTALGDEYRATQQVRVYHDGNGVNGPGIACFRDVIFQGPAPCTATISGYLIGK